MNSIQLENVTKQFDDVTAVDEIDLAVRDGEFLVLVGPSGCGKSTTLRLIAGLETATEGTVHIGGSDVTDDDPGERNVSMVFQDYALFPHMTARENITFGLTDSGEYTAEEIDQRVTEAASTLDIPELLDRKPSELSGGEKQRVAMGRSLVRDPDVFLMDEPLSNLDAKLRAETRTELADLHAEIQTTTVYVTHDQTEAMTLGDRVAVMNDGGIEQVDTPQQLYDYPQTQFVAEFIGSPSMNIVPVEIAKRSGGYRAVHEAFSIPLPCQPSLDAFGEETGLLGIRPEDFTPVDRTRNTDPHSIELAVDLVESMGDTLVVHCHVGDDDIQFVSYDAHYPVEETIEVTYDTEKLHVFDPQTGDAAYHSGHIENRPDQPDRQQLASIESE